MKQKFSCEKCGEIQEEEVNGREAKKDGLINWYLTAYVCKNCKHLNDIASVEWKGKRFRDGKEVRV